MKILFLTFFLLSTLLITSGCNWFSGEEEGSSNKLVGGECEYDEHPGTCLIISVDNPNENKALQLEEDQGYDVEYKYEPDDDVDLSQLGSEFSLYLTDGRKPDQAFLDKYNIKEGESFSCQLDLITSGTCSPTVFKFDDIDLSDYGE